MLPPNSDIGFVSPAPSNTTVSSAPDLTKDDPVTVDVPSIELTNLPIQQKHGALMMMLDYYLVGCCD
ncbi:MAG: hypothetical protein EZS28_039162, partial [Streblomastix strix]